MYALMLIVSTLTAWIMMLPSVAEKLKTVPFCKEGSSYNEICQVDGCGATQNCSSPLSQSAVGYLAVYRLLFAQTVFFALFSVIMIGVKSSRDPRAPIQNGFWAIKYLLLIGLSVGAFFIPEAQTFGTVWMYFGLVGGFCFILIQLILIIDFAHSWAEHWVERFEETESKWYYGGLFFFTILNYALAVAAIVLFYIYFTGTSGGCGLQKFFISFNLILCVGMSVLSILPVVQDGESAFVRADTNF